MEVKKELWTTLDYYNSLKHRLKSGYIFRDSLGVPLYHTKKEHHFNYMTDSNYYKQILSNEIFYVWYGSEGLILEKEINRTQENSKGEGGVLPIWRIYVESGAPAEINNITRERKN